MTGVEALRLGRAAYSRWAWADAFAQLSAADRQHPLEPVDLEWLATAAYLLGRDDSDELFARAHREAAGRGDAARAARAAFWLGFHLLLGGEPARGGGWLARAQRLLDEGRHDCVERGYLLVPAGLQRMRSGDAVAAQGDFGQVIELADRFGDPDLAALGRLGLGQSLIVAGRVGAGQAALDEVMVAVTAGEVSAVVAGLVYCAVIETCQQIFDLRRAQEWTAALSRWCAAQPDLVPYRGQCLVHRSQILQLHGAWPEATAEIRRACELPPGLPARPAAGAAFYQRGELHRLRGEFGPAEEAYHQASRWICEPQPGLALLRLMQGQVGAAAAASRRVVLGERMDRADRPGLLAAHVEIMLAAGDVPAARAGAAELTTIADRMRMPCLQAMAAQATGSVQVDAGDPDAATAALRRAWRCWQSLDAPYDSARVRVLLGLTCRAAGDDHSAEMEFAAAGWVFQQLGAAPDLARVRALSQTAAGAPTSELTLREQQVLRLVATGRTNRAVAADLFLSEKTVARHLSNIFTKLGLSSRAAATAYAYQHGIVEQTGA